VNQGHIKKHIEKLNYLTENKLIYGLGVSITNLNFAYINKLSTPNLVYHLIAGVNTLEQLKTLKAQSSHKEVKVLLLGYKVFGFGIKHFDENTLQNINNWKKNIREVFHICDIISFDNLALEQLNIKKVLTKEAWETFYMGDDGEYTMYIDAVKQEFARSSTSFKRQSFLETTLFSFFQKL
jgi:hypothetical protein